jgi:immune inhibitor A
MSVWCLSKLGWVKPKNLTKKSSLTLPPLDADKKAAYRMWTKGKASPEYFLLEHRQRAGRDQALPGQGLVLWHIDERQSDNTNPFAYRVAVVQADGRKDLERAANEGDGADAFPGTNNVTKVDDTTHPSTRDNLGNPTGTALSKIALAPGKVTLQVKV